MSSYKRDAQAFADEVLCAPWMIDDMAQRGQRVLEQAIEYSIPHVSDEHRDADDTDHYIEHFSLEYGIRTRVGAYGPSRRAYASVVNDHPAAIDIEYGARRGGEIVGRQRILGRALDAARDT